MFCEHANIGNMLGNFKLDNYMLRYNEFVPKLYNYCMSIGFEKGKIMPSRAFCSDESQGYPIILIAKHFGTFPFNHGQGGGIVAIDRHGPHAAHGEDMVIIQASHVGYDLQDSKFGIYRRLCTEHHHVTSNCGKIDDVLRWYRHEYKFAMNNIFIHKEGDDCYITIDNLLLRAGRTEGLFLNLDKLLTMETNKHCLHQTHSTSKTFYASEDLRKVCESSTGRRAIGKDLLPEHFYFSKVAANDARSSNQLDANLLPVMPWILTSKSPLLEAAKANTQVEFDRAIRTIVMERGYRGKRVIYIAGLHVDISPLPGQVFPLTKFVPWAAFIQKADGSREILEQNALFELLKTQSADNGDQVDLEKFISEMKYIEEIRVT